MPLIQISTSQQTVLLPIHVNQFYNWLANAALTDTPLNLSYSGSSPAATLTQSGTGHALDLNSGSATTPVKLRCLNDQTCEINVVSYSHSVATTAWGQTLANWGVLYNDGASTHGMIIGTEPNVPIIIGTNNVEVARFFGSGGINMLGAGSDPGAGVFQVNGELTAIQTANAETAIFKNTLNTSLGEILVENDAGANSVLALSVGGSTSVGTSFGLTIANWALVRENGSSSNGLAIGTLNAKPIVFGTNNAETGRAFSSGGWYLGGAGSDPGAGNLQVANRIAIGGVTFGLSISYGSGTTYNTSVADPTNTGSVRSYRAAATYTADQNDEVRGYEATVQLTVNSTRTVSRLSQFWADSVNATVNGTLTNHNALYLGTPGNGTTVKVIDTASGGWLSTAGVWTNASHEFTPDGKRWKIRKGAASGQLATLDVLRKINVHHYDVTDETFSETRTERDKDGKSVERIVTWHVDGSDQKDHIGVFAEELHALSPLLSRDGHGVDGVTLASFAILAAQALDKRIAALEAK